MTTKDKICPKQQRPKMWGGGRSLPTESPAICCEKDCAHWMEIPVNTGTGEVETKGYCADVVQAPATLDLVRLTAQQIGMMMGRANPAKPIILPGTLKIN